MVQISRLINQRLFTLLAIGAFVTIALLALTTSQASGLDGQRTTGFRALAGENASRFSMPGDMELVNSIHLSGYGLTLERYQQYELPTTAPCS